ncbi:MAG TPA: alpha/beta hydrolase [Polyangia bacterium]|nr:alpha/beta hydrolase [Polyangia bacterium]
MRFPIDGHEIDYEVRGEGRPVVMLHGLTVDRRVLEETCEPVLASADLRRIYLDLPGHGASTGNRERASADNLVAALAALTRELAGEQPCLFGYSYGGYLAQGLLREFPHASGLFLACPVVEPDFAKRTVPLRHIAAEEPDLPFSSDPRERDAFDEIAVRRTREVLAGFQKVVHPANISADLEFVAQTRGRYVMARPYLQALVEFEGPASIVCGRHDHWAGFEDAARLVRVLRRADFAVVADCGHLLPLEAPDRFRRALREFVDRLGQTA